MSDTTLQTSVERFIAEFKYHHAGVGPAVLVVEPEVAVALAQRDPHTGSWLPTLGKVEVRNLEDGEVVSRGTGRGLALVCTNLAAELVGVRAVEVR